MEEATDLGDFILCKTADGFEVELIKSELTAAERKCLTDGCFTGDTLVMTKEGLRRIDSTQEGDLVLGKNTNTGQLDYKPVLYVYRKSTREFINLTVAGKLIETTSTHLFMLEDGNWKSAENLKTGDRIVTANGDIKIVDSVEAKYYNEARRIFNLNVDDFHTYFVGNDGLLVHNDCSEAMARVAEAISKTPKLLDDFTIEVRNGIKYGDGFKPAVTSAAVDATDMSRVGYGCSSIYQNNPSIVNKVFSSADEYVAFYRKTLTDGYIDELVASNPVEFVGKDISSIKNEMAKLRARIQKTKDLAKAEGKYFSGNLNEPSFKNNWLVENCAEIWAVRDAVLQGSKLENIVLRSVDVKTGAVKPFCENCIRTFGDLMNSMN